VGEAEKLNIRQQAEKLRLLQCEQLDKNQHHIPWVMCKECGHVIMMAIAIPEGRCARRHPVKNPHFGWKPGEPHPEPEPEPQPQPVPPPRPADVAGRPTAGPGAASLVPEESPNFTRVAIVSFVYLALIIGGIAAGIYYTQG
jgi:hypothetical protein